MFRKKCLLLIGGSGQLGQATIKKFKSGLFRKWRVFNIDLVASESACENFIVDPTKLTTEVMEDLTEKVKKFDGEYEAVINLAGHFYPPNNKRYLRSIKEGEEEPLHPYNIASPSVFENYEAI